MTGRRGRRVAVVLVLLVGSVGAGTWAAFGSGSPQRQSIVDNASSVVTIAERRITSQRQVDGTLGFAGASTVLQPVGTSPDAVDQADQKASAAASDLAQATSDRAAAEAALAADFQKLTADQSRFDPDQQRVDADADRVAADRAAAAHARAAEATAAQSYGAATAAAADAHASALAFGPSAVYTALPDAGQVIDRGAALFAVSAQPVPLLYGSVVAWRPFRAGMTDGADVAELNRNLAELGYGGPAGSNVFTSTTAAAIRRLQHALGLMETGELRLGAVVFAPGPARVTAVTPRRGAAVQPGAPVVDITSTTRQVSVKLDAAAQSEVKVGDPVTITLPDNRTAEGTVTAVGSVATQPASTGPDATNAQPAVDVAITPSDGAATGNLDAAPVQVSITTGRVDHALVVPVTALLALGGGGYGVDVISAAGVHRVVAVTLGLFDDAGGLVQVSGPEVRAGQRVAVAAS